MNTTLSREEKISILSVVAIAVLVLGFLVFSWFTRLV